MTTPTNGQRPRYQFEDLIFDVARRRVARRGSSIEVAGLNFDLLKILVESAPNVVTYDDLAEKVWGRHFVSPENVAQRVMLLRQSLSDDASQPRYIETVRNKGYRLIPSVQTLPTDHAPETWPHRRLLLIAAALLAALGLAATGLYWLDPARRSAGTVADATLPNSAFSVEGQATVPIFSGIDPGAGPNAPIPNSMRAATAFDDAARGLGELNMISFEAIAEGPFKSLEVAPGVTVSQTGTTLEGGIVNGCFMDCASDVRRGYNITPGGEQYLGVSLVFEVGTATVDFSFDTPIQSFGTYVIGLGTANGNLSIEYDDGTPRSISVRGDVQGGTQFVGFTASGASISQVTLALRNVSGGSRDNFSVDEIRYTLADP
jgi:DNA-binding winged helix-turn-helix (wHTH) protein